MVIMKKERLRFQLRKNKYFRFIYRIQLSLYRTIKRHLNKHKKLTSTQNSLSIFSYKNIFCGYYDKTPFSPGSKNLILVHANNHIAFLKPKKNRKSSIILYDFENKEVIKKVAESSAWNWQQGSRASWIDEENLIYNYYDLTTDSYKSKIYNYVKDTYKKIPYATQDIFHNKIISICYKALNKFRPDYGYRAHKNNDYSNELVLYDYVNESKRILVTIDDIFINIKNKFHINPINGYFNHCMFSPDGNYFIYQLIYEYDNKKMIDLYLYDLKIGNNILLIHNKNISHYAWKNKNNFIFTGYNNEIFGYHSFNLSTKKSKLIFEYCDGHPYPNSRGFYYDTYPNHYNIRKLYFYDNHTKMSTLVREYIEPFVFFGESRCDLHPSENRSGTKIQVDYVNKFKRSVDIIDVKPQ